MKLDAWAWQKQISGNTYFIMRKTQVLTWRRSYEYNEIITLIIMQTKHKVEEAWLTQSSVIWAVIFTASNAQYNTVIYCILLPGCWAFPLGCCCCCCCSCCGSCAAAEAGARGLASAAGAATLAAAAGKPNGLLNQLRRSPLDISAPHVVAPGVSFVPCVGKHGGKENADMATQLCQFI